ncbi:TetR family transcriptional regulator [Streptomyces rugosispiralis]|uniref:TetR family transcriptional regulator n=1 Tax=Streptomyces rugosispiralis TaxID=2967341 RepID=A0ABT1UNS4_9ACTN|nr:TetR family transcriptional regulator [Streptomyces rugosispiralis]MCQ8186775.1 TetR family transcriptional regulator [Streptomyces rugosispiralis]
MARWDPGTEERLRKAALELFTERGYDQVTVTHIAERAGITRRTYFRYFPDKREVLFAHSDELAPAVAEAVRSAAPGTGDMAAVLNALATVGTYLTEHAKDPAQRQAVIRSSPELEERERTKLAALTDALQSALTSRGTANAQARAVAQLASLVFANAFTQWIELGGATGFRDCLRNATNTLREALATD